jgi:hypothetical protein
MTNPNSFERALKEARRALQSAYEERAIVEQRIINLTKSIDGLAALCEPESGEKFLVGGADDPSIFQITSLTDAIRRVFSKSSEPVLTPTEVRDALRAMGVDLAKYKQPLVPIHNTLKRLVEQEELVEFRDDNGELKGYRWVTPLARALAEIESPRWAEKARQVPDYVKQHLRRNGLPLPPPSDND